MTVWEAVLAPWSETRGIGSSIAWRPYRSFDRVRNNVSMLKAVDRFTDSPSEHHLRVSKLSLPNHRHLLLPWRTKPIAGTNHPRRNEMNRFARMGWET